MPLATDREVLIALELEATGRARRTLTTDLLTEVRRRRLEPLTDCAARIHGGLGDGRRATGAPRGVEVPQGSIPGPDGKPIGVLFEVRMPDGAIEVWRRTGSDQEFVARAEGTDDPQRRLRRAVRELVGAMQELTGLRWVPEIRLSTKGEEL